MSRVALGLDGIQDWMASQPFIDVMKCSRSWEARSATQWYHTSSEEMRTQGHVDSDGNPIRIPSGANRVGTIILTEINANDDTLNGRYRLTFDGAGTLQVNGGSNYSNGPGWIEFDYTATGGNMVTVEFTSIDTTNPPRNITCVHVDNLARHAAGELFRPAWLDVIKGHRLVRFMDWQKTNDSALSAWADRPRPTWASYARGVPVEVMVALCNQIKVDPWFCIPHLATNAYITNFATVVRNTLDPTLTAFYEYSNEVWNFQFEQAEYANAEALKLWPDFVNQTGWVQWYAGRSSQMAELVNTVYAGQLNRRRLPLTTQTGWDGLEDAILDAPRWVGTYPARRAPKEYMTDLSVSGYFGHSLSYDNTSRIQAWRRDYGDSGARTRMVAALNAEIDGLITTWTKLKTKANAAGLGMVMYEGGSHIVPDYNAVQADPTLMPFLDAFHYSDQMAALYTRAMTEFIKAGGEFFNAFVEVSRPGPYGLWGAKRHVADNNPRWNAIATFNQTTQQPEQPMPTIVKAYHHQNSLLDHQFGTNADKDTRVPNWAHRMAVAAGLTYEATGKFGFAQEWLIPPRADAVYQDPKVPTGVEAWPQNANWSGYPNVNALVFVPDNFDSQNRPPNADSNNASSPVGAGNNYVETILRHVDAWNTNAPNPNRIYYVYAGWADFKPRSGGGEWNSYTATQLQTYLTYSYGQYQKWYQDLVSMLKAARPNLKFELIDVQRVMLKTWQGTALKSLTGSRMWEDNSPHGTETWYLLAAIVYYMELFGQKPPASFRPNADAGVSSVMTNNWASIVDYAWAELGNTTAPVEPVPVEPTPEPTPTGAKPAIRPESPEYWDIENVGDGVQLRINIKKLQPAEPAVSSIRVRQATDGATAFDLPAEVGSYEFTPVASLPMDFQIGHTNVHGTGYFSTRVPMTPSVVEPDPVDPTPEPDPVDPTPDPVEPAPEETMRDVLVRMAVALEGIEVQVTRLADKP